MPVLKIASASIRIACDPCKDVSGVHILPAGDSIESNGQDVRHYTCPRSLSCLILKGGCSWEDFQRACWEDRYQSAIIPVWSNTLLQYCGGGSKIDASSSLYTSQGQLFMPAAKSTLVYQMKPQSVFMYTT